MALDNVPELLTITEAAELLRISRTTAYAEAKRFELTGAGPAGHPGGPQPANATGAAPPAHRR